MTNLLQHAKLFNAAKRATALVFRFLIGIFA
jgi:hypothetical protein